MYDTLNNYVRHITALFCGTVSIMNLMCRYSPFGECDAVGISSDVCNLWNLRNSTGYIRHKAQAPFVVLHSDQTLSLRYRKRTSTTTTTVFYLFINYYHYLYLRGVGN